MTNVKFAELEESLFEEDLQLFLEKANIRIALARTIDLDWCNISNQNARDELKEILKKVIATPNQFLKAEDLTKNIKEAIRDRAVEEFFRDNLIGDPIYE